MKILIIILCLFASPCFADEIRKILVEPVAATHTVLPAPQPAVDTEAYARVVVYSNDQEGKAKTVILKGADLALVTAITDTQVGTIRFWIHFNEAVEQKVETIENGEVVDVKIVAIPTKDQRLPEKVDFTTSPYSQKIDRELGTDLSEAITNLKNKLQE